MLEYVFLSACMHAYVHTYVHTYIHTFFLKTREKFNEYNAIQYNTMQYHTIQYTKRKSILYFIKNKMYKNK